jgi:hypothetical protein
MSVASCAAAVWVADYVGILMLVAFAASCAVAVWADYLRGSREEDPLTWYWATQFPVLQILLLVPSLVAAWWSWWGRAAALASFAALVYWYFRVFRVCLRVVREQDRARNVRHGPDGPDTPDQTGPV